MSCCPPHATISSSLPYHRLSASSSIINHFPEVTSPSYSSCCARGLGTAIRVHRALQAELALHLPKPEAPLGLRLAAASCPQALRMDSEGCSLLTQPQGRHRAQPAHGTLTPGPDPALLEAIQELTHVLVPLPSPRIGHRKQRKVHGKESGSWARLSSRSSTPRASVFRTTCTDFN